MDNFFKKPFHRTNSANYLWLMNYLDIILAVPLIWAAYKGFTRGLIVEVASLVGLILGIYGGIHFSGYAREWLQTQTEVPDQFLPIAAFGLTFIGIVIGIYFLGKALEKVVHMAAMKLVNKLAGLGFGLLKMALILSVVVFFMELANRRFHFIENEKRENSILYQPISGVASMLAGFLFEEEWDPKIFEKWNPVEEKQEEVQEAVEKAVGA